MSIREQIQAELKENPDLVGRDLARQLGCSETYVSNIRHNVHRKLYKRGSYLSKAKKEWIRDLWDQDFCATSIYRVTEVPLSKVIKFLQAEVLS